MAESVNLFLLENKDTFFFSQMLSAILLLLQLWDSGTQETDNERSAQGTSAPLLPLLQRFQSIICSKDTPPIEGDMHVSIIRRLHLSSSLYFSYPKSYTFLQDQGACLVVVCLGGSVYLLSTAVSQVWDTCGK